MSAKMCAVHAVVAPASAILHSSRFRRNTSSKSYARRRKSCGGELPAAIIQEFLDGQEYTIDIFTDFSGRPLCAVPRERLEVRGGEVAKSLTVKDEALI